MWIWILLTLLFSGFFMVIFVSDVTFYIFRIIKEVFSFFIGFVSLVILTAKKVIELIVMEFNRKC